MTGRPKSASSHSLASEESKVDALIDQLYRSEGPRLQRWFRRQMRPGEDARDFVQEAFLRLANAACKVVPGQPAAYLQRIARNLIIDNARRLKATGDVEASSLTSRPEQEDTLLLEDVMALYEEALQQLPERTRVIFLLHRIDDLPYRIIAERMGISIQAVQKHVAKALEHLTIALQDGE